MSTEIEFLCPPELEGRIPPPVPAGQGIPDWFRSLPRDMGRPDAHGLPGLTAKACLPMVDAMSAGWLLPLPFDVHVGPNQFGWLDFTWDDDLPFAPVADHHPGQIGAGREPFLDVQPRKWINPWRVRTSEGWSVIFCHPLNHAHLPFRCFDGLVDTDRLPVPVNAPFLWTAGHAPQTIAAGTPILQVIPVQRGAMPAATIRAATEAEMREEAEGLTRKNSEISVYRKDWRAKR